MRACGYAEINSYHTGETSYVRTFENGRFYPRFHAYIEEMPSGISVSLHLDAKQPSYEGFSAHSGEYDGPLVEGEMARIRELITHTRNAPSHVKKLGF